MQAAGATVYMVPWMRAFSTGTTHHHWGGLLGVGISYLKADVREKDITF